MFFLKIFYVKAISNERLDYYEIIKYGKTPNPNQETTQVIFGPEASVLTT